MRRSIILAALASLALAGSAAATELKLIASVPIPGEALKSFDISFVDQKTQRYYLADRSNKGLDIVDAKDNKYVGRVDGFVGVVEVNGKIQNSKSGPDGVVVFNDQAWVGDGDSTLKIVDLKTNKITATISTGGKGRLDELAYDPKGEVFIGINANDEPAFATLISTKPDHKIIAKLILPDATDGAEQPEYNPADGMFYLAIPELKGDKTKGGVAVIDPKDGKLVKILDVDNCQPHGLAFGPNQNFVLGCSVRGKDGMPPIIQIMNAKSGKVVATVPDIGGADMVAYSAKNKQYYIGGGNNPDGAALGVIDATTNKLVQKVPQKGQSTPHSVTVNDNNGYVFVPGGDGGCNCIQVYALQ